MTASGRTKLHVLICLTLTIARGSYSRESADSNGIAFRFFTKDLRSSAYVIQTAGKALGFENWPETGSFRVAPSIDKFALGISDAVGRERKAFSLVQFGNESWVCCEWQMDLFTEVEDKSLPEAVPREEYRNSVKSRREGSLSVEVLVAPNSRAAYEYLLYRLISNSMDPQLMVRLYTRVGKTAGLGTVSIGGNFVRDNVVVRVAAEGRYANEWQTIALNLDAQIQQQPVLTYQQLLARRPAITIAKEPEVVYSFKGSYRLWGVPVKVWAPDGQEIVWIGAWIDGVSTNLWEDGKILLVHNKTGPVKVKVEAVTSELLGSTAEQEVIIPER